MAMKMTRCRKASLGILAGLALLAAGCSLAPIEGPAPLRYRDDIFTAVTKTAAVTYGSAVNQQGVTQTLKMDIYRPTGDTDTHRPAVVLVHGGSFSGGDRNEVDIVDQANVFAKKGYVTASIDYRLGSPGCSQPSDPSCPAAIVDAQHDAQAAVRFFRRYATTYGVDPTRIAVSGTSAGAITALLVGYHSDDPGDSGNPGYSSAVRGAMSLSGAAIFNSVIGPGDAPALDFHGTADPLVPYKWAKSTQAAAQAAGLEFDLITYPGDGHVPYQHRTQILDLETRFLYHTLDSGHAADA